MTGTRVEEKSWWIFYLARPEVTKRFFRPHLGEIIELADPWRRGKALVLCLGSKRGFAIGLWTRSIHKDIIEDFADENTPDWLKYWDYDDEETVPTWLKPLKLHELGPQEEGLNSGESEQRDIAQPGEEVL